MIAPEYLTDDVVLRIRLMLFPSLNASVTSGELDQLPVVALHDFLLPDVALRLSRLVSGASFTPSRDLLRHSLSVAPDFLGSSSSLGSSLGVSSSSDAALHVDNADGFFSDLNKELHAFLCRILGDTYSEAYSLSCTPYRFTWKDYCMLAHDSAENTAPPVTALDSTHSQQTIQQTIDIFLDLTADWDDRAGGQLVYRDEAGEHVTVPVRFNTLILALRAPFSVHGTALLRFVTYCNHYSREKSRFLLQLGGEKLA